MTLKSKLATAALAAAVVLGFGAAAEAATIKYDTRVYADPGANPIGWVHSGQWVDVQGCFRNYCFIHKPGADGFVRSSAIWFDHGYDYDWWYAHPRPGFMWGPHPFPHGPGPFPGPGPGPFPGHHHMGPPPGACLHTPGMGFCVTP